MATQISEDQPGLYCSTSGTYFTNKDDLQEHYKSDFHRYNLKRKITGLPPVTRDWFEQRKAQLSGAAAAVGQKFWYDPLTRKRFASENTYLALAKSKKYTDLVRKSGQPAPQPVVTFKRLNAAGAGTEAVPPQQQQQQGFTTKPIHPSATSRPQPDEGDEGDEESGWETASDDDGLDDIAEEGNDERNNDPASTSGTGGAWDVRVGLFDNHVSASLEANLEYMWKKYGFYLPDATYLKDPEGLLQYLGAKLSEGHIPLYASGDDPASKQFPSLHAVQRHMVDTNRCQMLFEGNEEEYDNFYDYADADAAADAGGDIIMEGGDATHGATLANQGFELALPASEDGHLQRALGHRAFARFYRQHHRANDTRRSVAVGAVAAQYRRLGIATLQSPEEEAKRRAQKQTKRADRLELRTAMRENVNRNLPRNSFW